MSRELWNFVWVRFLAGVGISLAFALIIVTLFGQLQ